MVGSGEKKETQLRLLTDIQTYRQADIQFIKKQDQTTTVGRWRERERGEPLTVVL